MTQWTGIVTSSHVFCTAGSIKMILGGSKISERLKLVGVGTIVVVVGVGVGVVGVGVVVVVVAVAAVIVMSFVYSAGNAHCNLGKTLKRHQVNISSSY